MSDTYSKTRQSLYWHLSLKVPSELFRFVLSIVVVRYLEPKDFGIVSIASMLISYSNTITNFGFNQALVQRKEISKKHIDAVFTVDIIISLFMGIFFISLASQIAAFFNSPESELVIQIMALVFVLSTFYELPYTLSKRALDFKLISSVDLVRDMAMSIMTLMLAMFGYQYWALVWGQLIPLVGATVYLTVKSGYRPNFSYNHAAIRDLMNFGFWSFVRAQIYFLSTRIDRLFIGRFLDVSQLGLYDKAKSFSQTPTESLGANINTVLLSFFSRKQAAGLEDKRRIFKKCLTAFALIMMPVYTGLIAVADQFVPVLFGDQWAMITVPLQILSATGIFVSVNGLIGAFTIGLGSYRTYSVWQLLSAAFLIIVSFASVQYGINAVAFGVLLYGLLLLLSSVVMLKNEDLCSFKDFVCCIFPACICSVTMFCSVRVAVFLLPIRADMAKLTALVALGVGVYIISFWCMPMKELSELKSMAKNEVISFSNKISQTLRR